MRVSVFSHERLKTATVLPSRLARLRARFEPMTASPTTPMLAEGVVVMTSSLERGAGRVAASTE